MYDPPGGPLPAPTSGFCKWNNPKVVALQLTHLLRLLQTDLRGYRGSVFRRRPHQSANSEFRKLVRAGNLLARQLKVDCLCRPRANQNFLKSLAKCDCS
jgi:hypothetical protein